VLPQFFLCCILYKYDALTASDDLKEKMSLEQRDDYVLPSVLLSVLIVLSVFSTLGLSMLLLIGQLAKDSRLRFALQRRFAMQRQLDAEGLKRREMYVQLNNVTEADRREPLQQALRIMDTSLDEHAAANHVFGPKGLHPMYWGVSKEQLIEFGHEVRTALHRGEIKGQPDPSKKFYYPQEKFYDPAIGPNMHQVTGLTDPLMSTRSLGGLTPLSCHLGTQVNMGLIKPLTQNSKLRRLCMPGLSYALQRNFCKGGLLCRLFNSHAWDEGVFELITNAVNAWPDDCEGASAL
jgi:hypothetical protein